MLQLRSLSIILCFLPAVAWCQLGFSLFPADNTHNLAPDTQELIITDFMAVPEVGSGKVHLHSYLGDTLFSIPGSSDEVRILEDSIIITLPENLDAGHYYVTLDSNAFGSTYAIKSNRVWNFSTNVYVAYTDYSEEIGDRTLVEIGLPENYDPDRPTPYPVIYMTDGQHFKDVHEWARTLSGSGRMDEVITVSLSYPQSNDVINSLRTRDFLYQRDSFGDYIMQTLVPSIEAEFNVDPVKRVLKGNSFGGFFGLYTMFQAAAEKDLFFSDYVISSPTTALRFDEHDSIPLLYRQIRSLAEADLGIPTNLFVTVGDSESLLEPVRQFLDTLRSYDFHELILTSKILLEADHFSTNQPTTREGILRAMGASPLAPTLATGNSRDPNSIDLRWYYLVEDDVSDAIILERSLDGVSFGVVDTLSATGSFSDTDLMIESEYWYRTRALNRHGVSEYSNVLATRTGYVSPAVPSSLVASDTTAHAISLSWVDEADNEENYIIYRAIEEGTLRTLAELPANTTQFTDTLLNPLTTYSYSIRAVRFNTYSDYSDTVSVRTLGLAPSAPYNLVAVSSPENGITLSWDYEGDENEYFKIERKSIEEDDFIELANIDSFYREYTDSTIVSNKFYQYRINAVNQYGASDYALVLEAISWSGPLTSVAVLEGFKLYPSRVVSNGSIYLKGSDIDQISEIVLLDLYGRSEILQSTILTEDLLLLEIDIGRRGLYLLEIWTMDTEKIVKKVIVD